MDKPTILIVEDEFTINRIISNYFKNEEYKVLSAHDGLEGLKMFNENKIDLICLDIMMPKIDGFTVLNEIKNNIETNDIPIIFITAKTDNNIKQKALCLSLIINCLLYHSTRLRDFNTMTNPTNSLLVPT